jgi:hypothetical protein
MEVIVSFQFPLFADLTKVVTLIASYTIFLALFEKRPTSVD